MLYKYIPNLDQENAIKDRLARDPQNDTLKNFLTVISEIKKFPKVISSVPNKLLNEDLGSLNDAGIKEIVQQAPALKEQLEYYLQNRTTIESLKTYLGASSKVSNVAKEFFNKK